jgi:ADP-ribose pyrophosphatase YjhB (NUDIX family)
VIVERDGRALLLKRGIEPMRGAWVFPSGYVNRGEPVEAAAVREAREETGLEVTLGPLIGVYSYTGSPVVVLVWLAEAEGEAAPGEEALEIRWFGADAIPWNELAFPSSRDALEAWAAGAAGAPAP